jgi:hypothetical protein
MMRDALAKAGVTSQFVGEILEPAHV